MEKIFRGYFAPEGLGKRNGNVRAQRGIHLLVRSRAFGFEKRGRPNKGIRVYEGSGARAHRGNALSPLRHGRIPTAGIAQDDTEVVRNGDSAREWRGFGSGEWEMANNQVTAGGKSVPGMEGGWSGEGRGDWEDKLFREEW